jgi:hypothetical protein
VSRDSVQLAILVATIDDLNIGIDYPNVPTKEQVHTVFRPEFGQQFWAEYQ